MNNCIIHNSLHLHGLHYATICPSDILFSYELLFGLAKAVLVRQHVRLYSVSKHYLSFHPRI